MFTTQLFDIKIQFKSKYVSFQGQDEFTDDVDIKCKSKILLKFSFIAQTVSQLKVDKLQIQYQQGTKSLQLKCNLVFKSFL